MRLWIDGGSLHATRRCLKRVAKAEDATHQLHLATQLAFADKLVVGAFGGGEYQSNSEDVRRMLISLGYEPECIEIVQSTKNELHAIYKAAGDSLAAELERLVGVFDYSDSYPDFSGERRRMEELFDPTLRKPLSASERRDLLASIDGAENNGLLVMIAKSDAFWEVTRRLVGTGDSWTPKHSARIATLCRQFIHQECARGADAVYAPGKDRGKALRKIPEALLDHVSDLPGKVTEGFKLGDTGLPPVAAVLAQRAKGDPNGLMSEALEIRHKAKPLRIHINRVLQATAAGDAAARLHAYREMEQLTTDLKVHLSVKPPQSVLDAIDVWNPSGFLWTLVGSGGVVGGQKIVSVLLSLLRSRRIAVLSEMAAEIKVSGIDPTALAALERGVTGAT